MRAYSLDLRERIVAAVVAGTAPNVAAERFGIDRSTVYRYLRQQRHTGSLAPQPIPGRPRALPVEREPDLVRQLTLHPDATLAEQCDRWATQSGTRVSPATMSRMLARLGWTRKKGRWQPGNGTTPDGLLGGGRR